MQGGVVAPVEVQSKTSGVVGLFTYRAFHIEGLLRVSVQGCSSGFRLMRTPGVSLCLQGLRVLRGLRVKGLGFQV